MAVTIDSLELEILDNSEAVIAGLEKLKATLSGFKTLTSTTGFAKMSRQLGELSAAVNKMPGTQKMKEFAEGLSAMAAVPKANISKSLANQITAIGSAAASLDATAMSNLRDLKNALQPLAELGKPQLGSFVTQLKKLPEVATAFKNINMDAFAASIQRVTVAIRPLADEMAKVGAGFSALPSKIQRIIKSNESLSTANLKAGKTFGVMGIGISSLQAKFGIYYAMFSRAANVMGGWVTKSNEYVENLNLFTVSMGQYAGEALKYAEQVQSAMGIDMSEWIRTQGIFMQLGTGFGVAKDKAYQMSKALTQISYDLSSYFNIDIASAQDKVKSGFAGELEPLRNLGYALDQATLQQVAYKNGIQQSVNAMTQAQKSQLRYIAIMEQSRNVMGDMGRTLMTPANAMRILGQQTTQLTRALGNMLIPILMQIVPYVQAVVVVLTEAAQAIANLFGFTIPTIDYSGLDGLASGTGDVTAGLEEATSAAKELNGSLAFDELNIISKNNAPAGGGVGGGGDLGLDMGKFDYDFLGEAQNKVNEIAQSIRDFFSKWKDEIATIAKLLVGLWAVKKIADMVNWVKKLYTSFQALSIVKTISGLFSGFLQTFDLFYASGAGFFKSFDNGLRSIGDSMTGMQKFVGSVVALGVEFIIVKDVVRDLTLGQKNWTEALLILVPTCAAVGVAMYTMLGPVGLVLTAVTGLAAAAIGYAEAQNKIATDTTIALFYDGMGVRISDLAGQYISLFDAVTASSQPIIDNAKIIDDSKIAVTNTTREIEALVTGVGMGALGIEETLPKIKIAFDGLYSDTKDVLDKIRENILLALSGATGQAYEALGRDLAGITGLVEETASKMFTHLEEYKKQQTVIMDELAANPSRERVKELSVELLDVTQKIQGLTQTAAPELGLFNQSLNDAFGNINFENSATANTAIEDIGKSAGTAKEAINKSFEEINRSLEQYRSQWTEGSQEWIDFSEIIGVNEATRQAQLATIDTQVQSFLDQVQTDLVGGMKVRAEAAQQEWANMNWFDKWMAGGNEATYVSKMMMNYKTNIGDPFDTALKDTIAATGLDGKTWASTAMADIMMGYFSYNTDGSQSHLAEFKTNIETAIQNALPTKESVGELVYPLGGFIGEGMKLGLENSAPLPASAMTQMLTDMLTATHDGVWRFGSPSQTAMDFGLWIVEGLQGGIINNALLAINAVGKLTTDMIDRMKLQLGMKENVSLIFRGIGNTVITSLMLGIEDNRSALNALLEAVSSEVRTAMESIVSDVRSNVDDIVREAERAREAIEELQSMSVEVGISTKGIKGYSTGGYPEDGLFFANSNELVGRFENGRTAVANNDTIEAGIEEAAYRGFMRAMSQQQDRSIVVESVVNLDGNEIGRSVDHYNSNKGYSVGGAFANLY